MSFVDGNIASYLFAHAKKFPNRVALHIPQDREVSYKELCTHVQSLMTGLRTHGIEEEDRVVVLFPVCVNLYALIAAIYAIGAVAVLIDPGMGARRISSAIRTASPRAIISVQALLKFRWLMPALWWIPKKFCMDAHGWGLRPFSDLLGASQEGDCPIARDKGAPALITFTSGSTGAPKGANRHHHFLYEQHLALKKAFPPFPDQRDMTCFPVVAFHNISCGICTYMPDTDISKPAEVEPQKIVAQLQKYKISSLSAAPAFMKPLMRYLIDNEIELPDLQVLAVGGAPVSTQLQRDILEALPHTRSYIVYGSTEAEPIAHYRMVSPIPERAAFMAGKPVSFIALDIVNLPSREVHDLSLYRSDNIGEVIVSGAHVNRGYIDNPQANKENKIRIGDVVWHRTGDRGFFDEEGLLWLVGRCSSVLHGAWGSLDPFPFEVQLVGIDGIRQAALVVAQERIHCFLATDSWNEELRTQVREIIPEDVNVYTALHLPVDGRHNSKIDRMALKKWCTQWYIISSPPFRKVAL